jgi:hypothetical protein
MPVRRRRFGLFNDTTFTGAEAVQWMTKWLRSDECTLEQRVKDGVTE